ncbi:uncharacterized protein LY79DRAFT_572665 [Colletotrichum navitas]|uniref:Uncharacterized protein n=1 Tax=Colletotrichum navitas TaxID=681940 RepID=A0AAD8PJY1_9PEZI|nr:uncharacterized protein LY79DRAFT_572665 [Colletotrichum navitas]KAK1566123.1 hypothetical protein LY79DRAFT_572665 [Colletotrichum navitas]
MVPGTRRCRMTNARSAMPRWFLESRERQPSGCETGRPPASTCVDRFPGRQIT